MLPDGIDLEKLLECLFEDNEDPDAEEIIVLKNRIFPPKTSSSCCSYNYTAYA